MKIDTKVSFSTIYRTFTPLSLSSDIYFLENLNLSIRYDTQSDECRLDITMLNRIDF